MNKERIAYFGIKFYPSKGGSSRIAESIARRLRDKYEITFYCYKTPEAFAYMDGVNVVQFPKLPGGTLGVFAYYFLCCIHLLFSKKYDLIHVHKTDSAIFIPLLRLKSKVIATSQEAPYVRDKWNAVGKAYFHMMEWFFIHSSALLTSVSKPLADYYYDRYRRDVHYVPNGVDIYDDRNFKEAKAILDKHGVKGEYIFFAARRIMSTKGCHTFLAGLKKINYQGTVVIAGQASHATAYMEKIKKLSEGLDVKFIGYVGKKDTLMALVEMAELFIFPSETEGLSLMLLEVGSTAQTPLICSDIPENTQVFSNDEVLFFRNKDSDDFAQKFQWAQKHPDEMAERSKAARERVIEEYSSQVVADTYDSLYVKLLNK